MKRVMGTAVAGIALVGGLTACQPATGQGARPVHITHVTVVHHTPVVHVTVHHVVVHHVVTHKVSLKK